VLYVGRVNREKGIELLIPAFARVLARRPDARLVLVGAVYEPRWLTGLLREVGADVADRVVLAGEQPPRVVAAAYGAASVFAFPSRTDTQALVLQEAALAGRPVIMVDPILHAAGPLRGRAVLATADPDAFGGAVADLLDDRPRADALAAAATAHAASHTPARYAEAVHEAYEQARGRTRAGRRGLTRTA
jgi:glycosyltransferase involved in cell wall biosynthesis